MNDGELNRLYELLDASYTANCMLISNELSGSSEKTAIFSSFATGGFFLARNVADLENIEVVMRDNLSINLLSQISELLSCYAIIVFGLRSPDKNRVKDYYKEFIQIFEINKFESRLLLLFDQFDFELNNNIAPKKSSRFAFITDIIREVLTGESSIPWDQINVPVEFNSDYTKGIEDYDQFVNFWTAMEEECFELVLEGLKEFQSEN
mgnify:FL=1|jgi:hypothetical protein|tara:strand:+ start:16 stop:639 length:624 start_codon:yes stop_codon:yes gene_type:complete